MKTLFLTLITIVFAITLQAQVNQTFICTPGQLSSQMSTFLMQNSQSTIATISKITLSGTIDQRDLQSLNQYTNSSNGIAFTKVSEVDLSSVTIAGYSTYPANQFNSFNNNTLSEIILPNTITSIGKLAFENSINLTNITIPTSVTLIEQGAFSYSTKLTNIGLPANVDSLGEGVFSGCTSLSSISLPNNLKTISNLQFKGCTSLQTVIIPEGITKFGYNVFEGCTSLTYVSLPSTLTKTGTSTFKGCSSLESITLPPHLSAIEDWTFIDCSSLVSITIPSEATYIRSEAFSGCNSLTSVSLPASINDIRFDAFAGCRGMISVAQSNPYYSSTNGILFNKSKTLLVHYPSMKKDTSYVVPSTVTRLEYSAFDNCSNLKTITIPSNVLYFNGNEFLNCTGLKSIYNKNKIPNSLPNNDLYEYTFFNVDTTNCILYVPKGSKALYEVANQWKKFVHIVEIEILSVSSNTVSLTNGASNNSTVAVTTDSVWTASSSEQWLTIVPQIATSGNGIITFTTTVNTTTEPRTATVEVQTNGASELITITQAAGILPSTLSVSVNSVSIAKDAGSSASIDITSNVTWTAISNQSWLTVNPNTSYLGDGTLILTGTANPNSTVRTATITVSANGVTSKTIIVTQEANVETLIPENTSEKITIYPNPTKTDFVINCNAIVCVYSSTGELLIRKNVKKEERIMTDNLTKGFYFISVLNDTNSLHTETLIVE